MSLLPKKREGWLLSKQRWGRHSVWRKEGDGLISVKTKGIAEDPLEGRQRESIKFDVLTFWGVDETVS